MNARWLHLLVGVLGGLSATGPMTIFMCRGHRRLPPNEQHALPPREITDELESKAGAVPSSGPGKGAVTLLNHFAYGAAAGGIYASLGGKKRGALGGVIFGGAVWLVSYLGLLPAAALLKPASEHTARRNFLMFAAHLVWGLLLGLFVQEVMEEERSGALVTPSARPERDRPKEGEPDS